MLEQQSNRRVARGLNWRKMAGTGVNDNVNGAGWRRGSGLVEGSVQKHDEFQSIFGQNVSYCSSAWGELRREINIHEHLDVF